MRQILAVQLFFGMTFRAGRSSKVAVALILALSLGEMASLAFGEHSPAGNDPLATLVGSDQPPGGL